MKSSPTENVSQASISASTRSLAKDWSVSGQRKPSVQGRSGIAKNGVSEKSFGSSLRTPSVRIGL